MGNQIEKHAQTTTTATSSITSIRLDPHPVGLIKPTPLRKLIGGVQNNSHHRVALHENDDDDVGSHLTRLANIVNSNSDGRQSDELSEHRQLMISTEMVNASGRGSNGNLQSLGSGGGALMAAPAVTTSTASATGMLTMGVGNTSAYTSQHSAGGEFFYFDDDLRDFSSAADSAAQPVPAAADLIAADVDVESIERLLDRLRRADMAHGQRQSAKQQQQQQPTSNGDANTAAALQALMLAHRQTDLFRQQTQNTQQQFATGGQGGASNRNNTLALFGMGGQSKSDSCLAGSRSSPDTYGLLSGSTGGAGDIILPGGRELSMSWPLNDSAIVFRQYPLFADDTALMLTSSMLAACPGGDPNIAGATKSATVASGLTTAALLQAHRRQQQQQMILQHQLQNQPQTTSTTGSMTLNSELMDVLSRKHNYRLTFAGQNNQQQGAIGRSGMNDSLASDRSHLSRGSAADFAEFFGASSSAAAKAALLKRLQDDLNARCVNMTYERIKNQLFGGQQKGSVPNQSETPSSGRELAALDNVHVFQPIEKAPTSAERQPLKPTLSSGTSKQQQLIPSPQQPNSGRRSRNPSENCGSPATDNNSADDPGDANAESLQNSLHIDSSDLEVVDSLEMDQRKASIKSNEVNDVTAGGAVENENNKSRRSKNVRKKQPQNRSKTVGATTAAAVEEAAAKVKADRRRTASETRSSSMPLSSQVNAGCIDAMRTRSANQVETVDRRGDNGRELQFAWPVPKSPHRTKQQRSPQAQQSPRMQPKFSQPPSPLNGSPAHQQRHPIKPIGSVDEDDELAGTTRYHSPSPVKAVSNAASKPALATIRQNTRRSTSISPSPSSSASTSSSSSASDSETSSFTSSCCDDDHLNRHHHRHGCDSRSRRHRHHHHHRHHHRRRSSPSSRNQTSCQTVVPSVPSGNPAGLATIAANIAVVGHESPLPPTSTLVTGASNTAGASPGACSSSSYATVGSHQRSRHPTQIMAANFIPPALSAGVPSTATSSAHHASPQTCPQHTSCLCLAFAQIWHSVLTTHAAQTGTSSGPSSCLCQHTNTTPQNIGHTLSRLTQNLPAAASATTSPPSVRHHHHRHSHQCKSSKRHSSRRHRRLSIDAQSEDLRTVGTQFPVHCHDGFTQTPPTSSPQMTTRSAIVRNTSQQSPDLHQGPVAVIFDPQSRTSSNTTSPPDTATTTADSPPVVKSYFFTFRSMPNVSFLRSPVDSRTAQRQWRLDKIAAEESSAQQPPESDKGSLKKPDNQPVAAAPKHQTTAPMSAAAILHCTQPPPPPRPPRNHRGHRRNGSNGGNNQPQQTQQHPQKAVHSSGDSGASLASYSVDTLSRSPRFTEEESGISGGMQQQQQSPPGVMMEQCGRRLLLLPHNPSSAVGKLLSKDSPSNEHPPATKARLQPCIAEELSSAAPSAAATALLSATVDLQSPSNALLHNRVTSSPDVKPPKDLFPRGHQNNAFLFNDETVACLHATSPFINPTLRREEEQAKERVRSLGNAVDEILHLFEPTTANSAPTATNAFNAKRASLHYVVYSALCPSLVHLLSHGFMPEGNVSLFSAVVEIITSGEVSEQSVTLVCQVAEMRLADSDDKKLLALFVGLLNLRWLPQWLCELYQNQEGVRRFYAENALLAAATSGCRALFWAAVQSLRPLSTLDLQLSLTSILNHHDVSSGAFPTVNTTSHLSSHSPRPPASPVPAATQQRLKLATPASVPTAAVAPTQVTSPVAPIANTDEIQMDDLMPSQTTGSSNNSKTSPSKSAIPRSESAQNTKQQQQPQQRPTTSSGIPTSGSASPAPQIQKVTLGSTGNIPKPAMTVGAIPAPAQQRKVISMKQATEQSVAVDATVEKAQPINVVPSINEPPKGLSGSLLRPKAGTPDGRRSVNATLPLAPPTPLSTPSGLTAHPPSTPSTTPLSGNRVRLPSSTPIFQRGNSTDSKAKQTTIPSSTGRSAAASPATVMGNSSSSRHHRATANSNGDTPASLTNITASSSSGSAASPSSRRRPLTISGAAKRS